MESKTVSSLKEKLESEIKDLRFQNDLTRIIKIQMISRYYFMIEDLVS